MSQVVEKVKEKFSKTNKPKTEKKEKTLPKSDDKPLAKNKLKELHIEGKFFSGIIEARIVKSDLELSRTQRIIIKDNGVTYEYTRTKRPY